MANSVAAGWGGCKRVARVLTGRGGRVHGGGSKWTCVRNGDKMARLGKWEARASESHLDLMRIAQGTRQGSSQTVSVGPRSGNGVRKRERIRKGERRKDAGSLI